MSKQFIGYTAALQSMHKNLRFSKMIGFEFSEENNCVIIEAVSGHNLGKLKGIRSVSVTRETFDNRETAPHDSLVEWRWAADLTGVYT